MKYDVHLYYRCYTTRAVEANSPEEAKEKASKRESRMRASFGNNYDDLANQLERAPEDDAVELVEENHG